MAHTTGFEDRALGQLFEQDPSRVRSLATYLRQERPKRVREAGTFPTYSNYGAALAGEIVAHVTGQTFEQYVERQIIGKLGLSHMTLREPYPQTQGLPAPMRAELARQLSQGFVWTGGRFETRPFEYVSQIGPAGSGSATAADMGRYMQMILNGGNLDGAIIYGPATAGPSRPPSSARPLVKIAGTMDLSTMPCPAAFAARGIRAQP
jgi:CubicO group peptidase (beta-lactamase class C family)